MATAADAACALFTTAGVTSNTVPSADAARREGLPRPRRIAKAGLGARLRLFLRTTIFVIQPQFRFIEYFGARAMTYFSLQEA